MKISEITHQTEPVQGKVFRKKTNLADAQDPEIAGLQRKAKLGAANAAQARAQTASIRAQKARERALKAMSKVNS
jgi:hypothetical protein